MNPKHPKQSNRTESEVPANPLPAPNQGEMNQMEPTETAEQATWQPYRASTAHAEPPGHLDEHGLKDQDDLAKPRQRHGDKHEVTDKDE